MRTLTQVWIFFTALTFAFLFLGFQLAGRSGLFITFLISLYLTYAALHRGIRLFKNNLGAKEFRGNDSSGFLNAIESNKTKFGFIKVHVYLTEHNTPPLVWRNRATEAHLLINAQLPDNLNPKEIHLLSLLLLSHLEKRSFLITPLLSVINQSLSNLNIFSFLLSSIVNFLFNTKQDILNADKKFHNIADTNPFELGFFLNKLHHFDFNQNKKNMGFEYFSILSMNPNDFHNQYGIPNLKLRLEKIMGFAI